MVTKGYGFSVSDIDASCPSDLKPYENAYSMERERRDAEMWLYWGSYGLSAVMVAIERNLEGRKAKGKYLESPVLSGEKVENSELELQKQRIMFMEKLKMMQTNFELSHPKNENNSSEDK